MTERKYSRMFIYLFLLDIKDNFNFLLCNFYFFSKLSIVFIYSIASEIRKTNEISSLKYSTHRVGFGGGMSKQNIEHSQGHENTLYDTIRWIQDIIHFSKPKERRTPRVSHIMNCRLWVIRKCQERFIRCKKFMLITGDVMQVWRQGVFRKSVPSPQFCCEPNSALKKIKS